MVLGAAEGIRWSKLGMSSAVGGLATSQHHVDGPCPDVLSLVCQHRHQDILSVGPEPTCLQLVQSDLPVDGIQPHRTHQEKVEISGAISDVSVYTISEPAWGVHDNNYWRLWAGQLLGQFPPMVPFIEQPQSDTSIYTIEHSVTKAPVVGRVA